MTAVPLPEVTPLTEPYWSGLAEGELRFQRCGSCANVWLPARDACPQCLAPGPTWEPAGGGGRIISWVVYHQAVHEAFADRVPYNVAIVELDEGPRLITNIEAPESILSIELPVELHIVDEGGVAIPRFIPAGAG